MSSSQHAFADLLSPHGTLPQEQRHLPLLNQSHEGMAPMIDAGLFDPSRAVGRGPTSRPISMLDRNHSSNWGHGGALGHVALGLDKTEEKLPSFGESVVARARQIAADRYRRNALDMGFHTEEEHQNLRNLEEYWFRFAELERKHFKP